MRMSRPVPGYVQQAVTALLSPFVPGISWETLSRAIRAADEAGEAAPGKKLLTCREVEERLGVSRWTVRRMVAEGQIEVVRVGRRPRYRLGRLVEGGNRTDRTDRVYGGA